MNVIVCLKQVPGTIEVKIDPQTNTLIRQGIKSITNPFDQFALEEAVRLKERTGGGKVTVITMGPPQAEEMLREAISVGADEAILLSDRAFAGADTLATSFTLAKAIEKIKDYELVICGRQTTDGDTGQVGPEISQVLGIPFVSYVNKVEATGTGNITLKRMVEDGHETLETPLPAVITVVKEINAPRLPSLRGIAKSKAAKITVWTAKDVGLDENEAGQAGSATRVVKIFFPKRISHSEMLSGSPEEQAGKLFAKLKESKIL